MPIGEPFVIKKGDTRPRYVVHLQDKYGTPQAEALDLADLEVEKIFIVMRLEGTSDSDPPKIRALATMDDKPNGVVSYPWVEGDTDTPGTYKVEFEMLTEDEEGIETIPNEDFFVVKVVDDLG